jgi:aldose 1-epimerase
MAALSAIGALAASCFPMIPWVSRITHGRFDFAGRSAQLPPAPDGSQHALHGFGWRSAWDVTAQDATSLTLTQTYAPPGWPWRAHATFTMALAPHALRLDLALTNLDDAPMPGGLGFHPYFPRAQDTQLIADLGGVWEMNRGGFPARPAAALDAWNWRDPDGFAGATLDNVFTGFRGPARLYTLSTGRRLAITASEDCDHLIVYAPPGADFCCVEPVTSMTDAVNRPEPADVTGLRTIAPGATLAVWMQIDVEA